ncbi:MAG: hypothetical protein GY847_11525 [Proteobacteria bacterium]|nr:hypothetical protein [Pseudomonadota bacterium]
MKDNSEKSTSERRLRPRHKIKIDVNYRRDETYLFSKTENLSELGIFLVSKDPFPKGTRLALRFLSPEGGDPIEISGDVVWIERGTGGKQSGMGVRFANLNTQTSDRIKALIRTFAYLE